MIGTTTMNSRRTTLLIALLLAAVTGWLTLTYVRSVQQNDLGAARTVYVASAEIPARTTITAGMISRVTCPGAAVESDAVINPSDAIGQVALITIPAGGQITESKLGRTGEAGLSVRLEPGKRAVSIEIDKVKGVSGLMQPGDRVDVIAIPAPKTMNDQPPPAATILRGIRVLAIGGSLQYNPATPSPQENAAMTSTVTLEVTPKQADLLAMADESTKLRLSLRPPRERVNSQPSEALHWAQIAPLIAAAAPPAAKAIAAPAPPSTPKVQKPTGIMVIDGDRIEYGHTASDDANKPSFDLGSLLKP